MTSEKQKMLTGQAYRAFGDELFGERQRAKELLFEFNSLSPTDLDRRGELLRQLLGGAGENCYIEPPFRCDYGYNIKVGRNFYANYNLVVLDCAPVTIGDDVLLAPNVAIYAATHPVHPGPRKDGYEHALPVRIGHGVWIGGNVVINPDISIGDNTVVGSGSVVTRSLPANVVAAGNPCRVLRPISEQDRSRYLDSMGLG